MIQTTEALGLIVARAMRLSCVALDTEFANQGIFHPQLNLIQLALGEDEVALIDPLAIDDLTPLRELLETVDVVKVLHDPVQDLQLLAPAAGAYAKRVFDTQRAAGFVGLPYNLSLANLLSELLGVTLSKSETRSDWRRRPLSPRQRNYAADDVRYLCAAYQVILDRAEERGRRAWLADEMIRFEDAALYAPPDPGQEYLRVPGAKQLRGQKRAAVQAVAAWRMEMASADDVPRKYILSNDDVLGVALAMPRGIKHLHGIAHRSRRLPKGHKHALLQAIQAVRTMPPGQYPAPSVPLKKSQQSRVKRMLQRVRERSEGAGLDATLVATRRNVEDLVRGYDSPLLHGWRYAFIGKELESGLQPARP